MRLTIAYSKIKKTRSIVFINNGTYQRETVSEQPIRPPLSHQARHTYKDDFNQSEDEIQGIHNLTKHNMCK